MREDTTEEQRSGYNDVLDRAFDHGRFVAAEFEEQLNQMRSEGVIDLFDNDIEEASKEQACVSTAHYITHNQPSQREQSLYQEVLTRADHKNGAGSSVQYNKYQHETTKCAPEG